MIKKSGQTALILILLSAAALIFFAITLNWGRVAQNKTLLTIGTDQAAALLGSEMASYGEMEKQTYLQNSNQYTALTGVLFDVILIIVAIVAAVLSFGVGGILTVTVIGEVLAVTAAVMAIANLALQVAVVSPGITSMWNKLQKNQPVPQQFFEQAISTALQSTVTDQVNVTDYFDLNTNGQFGVNSSGSSNDAIGRFAFYYTDRLKMLNQPDIPQVVFFYSQMGELVNGQTCAQNASDHNLYPTTIPINAACLALNMTDGTGQYCVNAPTDPNCEKLIAGGFELDDPCQDSNPNIPATYNPYCDPCCQPLKENDPLYNAASPSPLHPTPTINVRPFTCPDQTDDTPANCVNNNPYVGLLPGGGTPYLLYDPAFQEYGKQLSFLDQYGRDQQAPLPGPPPPTQLPEPPFDPMTFQGTFPTGTSNGFPSGIYPLFYLLKNYSPEVNSITNPPLLASQYHWCTSAVTPPFGYVPPSPAIMAYFPELAQFTIAACSGADCCINVLDDGLDVVGNPTATGNLKMDRVEGVPAVPPSDVPDMALDPSYGENGPDVSCPSLPNGKCTWIAGDNQFCSAVTPPASFAYNGSLMVAPDGTCEWNDTIWNNGTPLPATISPTPPNAGTVDALDDVQHTLSDFVVFAHTFLQQNVDTLSSTFDSWYNQVAEWIAPGCGGASPYAQNPLTCNDGGDGRLLSVANTLNNWVGPDGTTGEIGLWLNNTYVDPNSWCVPAENTLVAQNDPFNDCPSNNCSTNEDVFINSQAGAGPWGDLPHVLACLDYNAGAFATPAAVNPNPVSVYNQCLTDLQASAVAGATAGGLSSTCTFPLSCSDLILGRSLTGQLPPAFKAGSVTPTPAPTCGLGTAPGSGVCAAPGTSGGVCSDVPTTVTVPDLPPGLGSTSTTTTVATCCASDCTVCSCPCSPCAISNAACNGCISTICGANCTTVPSATNVTYNSADCNPAIPGSYANWVQRSLTLAQIAAPRFAQRVPFLNDMLTRVKSMQALLAQGNTSLQNFLKPGGPADQLMYARSIGSPAQKLPNSVIYGWQDNPAPHNAGGCVNGQGVKVGCAHIVKVTAYSTGRSGTQPGYNTVMPWVKTTTGWFTRSYTLTDRDGPVYVSVKRWDQNHGTAVAFPNGHALWQSSFSNPTSTANFLGSGIPPECLGLNGATIGFGLMPGTVTGLNLSNYSSSINDKNALAQAFMLNDQENGTANVDPTALDNGTYNDCLAWANQMLDGAPESHVCVQYIASSDAVGPSCPSTGCTGTEKDYSLKFVACPVEQDDLTWGE